MNRILLVALSAFFALGVMAQNKKTHFRILDKGFVQNTQPYIEALNTAGIEAYRKENTSRTILFDTGLKVELLSAKALKEEYGRAYNTRIINTKGVKADPVFTLTETGQLKEVDWKYAETTFAISGNYTEDHIKALKRANLDGYRLLEQRRTLKFDTGATVELFSAKEIDDQWQEATPYQLRGDEPVYHNVFTLGANNTMMELIEVVEDDEAVKVKMKQ